MSVENDTAEAIQTEVKQQEAKPQIMSVGKPTPFTFGGNQQQAAVDIISESEIVNNIPESGQEGENIQSDAKPTFNLQEYLKEQGIEFEGGIEELKTKLKPQGAEPTPEEIQKKNDTLERRMLDKHLENGGKVEDFAALKRLKNATELDVAEMSRNIARKELLDAGISENKVDQVLNKRYLQDKLDAIEIGDDETDAEFEARKAEIEADHEKEVKYGANKLANRSLYIKNDAEKHWNTLKTLVEQEDQEVAKDSKFSAEVDTYLQALPKKQTLSIGKIDGKDIEPIVYEIPEEVTTEISTLLKDKNQLQKFLFDEKGNINIQTITDLLVAKKMTDKLALETFKKGGTHQVNIYSKQFPARSAHEVGIGGSNGKPQFAKGQPVSAGKVQRFKPTY